ALPGHGHEAALRLDGGHEAALLERPELARARARALREDEEAGPRAQGGRRAREGARRLQAVAAVDGHEAGAPQRVPEEWPGEDLLLDDGLEVGAQRVEQDRRVEMAHVVRDHDRIARVSHV